MQIIKSKTSDKAVPVWGDPIDYSALTQIQRCVESDSSAYGAAMMADHHKGYAQPIGGVVAYRDAVSPSGVGYDIGCGNDAVRLNVLAADVRKDISKIMDMIFANLSFGVGRTNADEVETTLFDAPVWKEKSLAPLKGMAREQLGTIGSGNHYVDLLEDEEGWTWVGVHFGSRGLGHKIATYFLNAGGAKDGIDVDPLVLPLNGSSTLGWDYIEAMKLAGTYAQLGRGWVCEKVSEMLGAKTNKRIQNHHNYAWLEEHDGRMLWVIRKGATPAFPGQSGFIGGSMGDNAYIVEGIDSIESKMSFYSAPHGAGRVMSRKAAKRDISEGDMKAWIELAEVTLRGGGLDESPQAYKRLDDVLEQHRKTLKIVHTLKPFGVAMAGKETFDPWKD